MTQRFVPANVAAGLEQVTLLPLWAAYSRPLRIRFPAVPDKPQDILHGLEATPDGFFTVYADADIHAVPGRPWTRELAYLVAPWVANAHAIVIFFTLREDPTDA